MIKYSCARPKAMVPCFPFFNAHLVPNACPHLLFTPTSLLQVVSIPYPVSIFYPLSPFLSCPPCHMASVTLSKKC